MLAGGCRCTFFQNKPMCIMLISHFRLLLMKVSSLLIFFFLDMYWLVCMDFPITENFMKFE